MTLFIEEEEESFAMSMFLQVDESVDADGDGLVNACAIAKLEMVRKRNIVATLNPLMSVFEDIDKRIDARCQFSARLAVSSLYILFDCLCFYEQESSL
jgi:hypothetical protein